MVTAQPHVKKTRILSVCACGAPANTQNSAIFLAWLSSYGKPIFRMTLAEELGYKTGSGVFRDLITSSAGYGLTNGSYVSEKIGLEQPGIELAHDMLDSDINVLFSVEIFNKFYDNFGRGGSADSDSIL